MAYWIHENGETIGPLRMVEVVERAQPETLVSQGQEWVRFDAHPAFPSCSNDEPESARKQEIEPTEDEGGEDRFWLWENEKAIGPFSSDEVLATANGNTLVSRGQEWIPIGEHPAFRKYASFLPGVAGTSSLEDCNPRSRDVFEGRRRLESTESEDRPVDNESRPSSPENRPDKQESESFAVAQIVQNLKRHWVESSMVVRFASILGAVLVMAFVIPALMHTLGISVVSDSKTGLRFHRAPRWVYSKALNTTTYSREFWPFGDVLISLGEDIERHITSGGFSVHDSIGLIDIQKWQEMSRETQGVLLLEIAALRCMCTDPSSWTAEIRNAATHELLASISPNGVRALWTAQGYLPETPPSIKRIDLESPQSSDEKAKALKYLNGTTKALTENQFWIDGTVEDVVTIPIGEMFESVGIDAADTTNEMRFILIRGFLRPHEKSPMANTPYHNSQVSNPRKLVVFNSMDKVSPGVGAGFHGLCRYEETFEEAIYAYYGKAFPVFMKSDPQTFEQTLRARRSIETGLRSISDNPKELLDGSLPSEADLQTPEEINSRIEGLQTEFQMAKEKLKPLRAEIDALQGQDLAFQISGEIRDQDGDKILIWGTAMPLNGDYGHLGTQQRAGNILVGGVTRLSSSYYFNGKDLHFIGKTILKNAYGGDVPVRVFSTQPSQEVAEAVKKVREQMAPFSRRMDCIRWELDILESKKKKLTAI